MDSKTNKFILKSIVVISVLIGMTACGRKSVGNKLKSAIDSGCYEAVAECVESGENIDSVKAGALSKESSIKYALKYANADIAKLLIDSGADVNYTDSTGATVLHYLAGKSEKVSYGLHSMGISFEMMNYLIEHGADVNAEDADGNTPLFYASAPRKGGSDMILLLLQNGASVTENCVVNSLTQYDDTAEEEPFGLLLEAMNVEPTSYYSVLLQYSDRLNADEDGNDRTLRELLLSAAYASKEAFEEFLGSNADSLTSEIKAQLIQIAFRNGRVDHVSMLVQKWNLSQTDQTRLLDAAIQAGYEESVEAMLDAGWMTGNWALNAASSSVDFFEWIWERLGAEANPNQIRDAYYAASAKGNLSILSKLDKLVSDADKATALSDHLLLNQQTVDYFKDSGILELLSNDQVYWLLDRAVKVGEYEILSELLSAGLNVNTVPQGCNTLFGKALSRGRLDLMKLLIEYGAEPSESDLEQAKDSPSERIRSFCAANA